jgi:mortality factor 4-like protein 1
LLKEHYAAMREKKKASKVAGTSGGPPFPKEGGKRSGGGSANTSRASTPVSERSFMIAPSLVSSTVTAAKRTLADDEISISSHEDHPVSRRLGKRTRLSDTMLDDTDSWKFRIEIPEELKYVLVSDGELVSQKKLFGLPAKMSVGTILSDYVKHVEKLQLDNIGAVSEVILGIKEFFNSTVCLQLLYKQEKPQYANKVAKENVAPSDIYGSPHLLRLMVKIGPLLNQSTIDATSESNVGLIENVIGDFLIYLEANRSRLFTSKNYTESVDEYDSVKDSQI